MDGRWLLLGLLAAGCATKTPAQKDGPATHTAAARLPPCGEPTPGVPRLESYSRVQIPGTYWVDMTFDGREWSPADPIGMPAHHASRLELTNLDGFAVLASHQAERLRFSVEITAREIRQAASVNQWRAEYYARIIEACSRRSESDTRGAEGHSGQEQRTQSKRVGQ